MSRPMSRVGLAFLELLDCIDEFEVITIPKMTREVRSYRIAIWKRRHWNIKKNVTFLTNKGLQYAVRLKDSE